MGGGQMGVSCEGEAMILYVIRRYRTDGNR